MTITFANVKSAKGAEWSLVDESCSWTKEGTKVTWTAEKRSQPPQELERLAVRANQKGEAGRGDPESPQPEAPQQQEQTDTAGGLAWFSVPTVYHSSQTSG